MNWLDKIIPPKIQTKTRLGRKGVPEGVWSNCNNCQEVLYRQELELGLHVCPKCDHHMRIGGLDRLSAFLDNTGDLSAQLIGEDVQPLDILRFKDQKKYRDRLQDARKSNTASEALICAEGTVMGIPLTAAAFDFRFLGGSMGSVVGERFVQAANRSYEKRIPLVSFSASGGARMQEALFSLMQMAKTSAVIARNRRAGIPFISVLTDPTMGGVSASLAMLGDVIIAEPGALVGFAGPRVIEQTVRETLPAGFQRAEFLLEHGAIDMIIDRRQLRQQTSMLLEKLGFGQGFDPLGDEGEQAATEGDETLPAADQPATELLPPMAEDSMPPDVTIDVEPSDADLNR